VAGEEEYAEEATLDPYLQKLSGVDYDGRRK
jgi:hypothetical protein